MKMIILLSLLLFSGLATAGADCDFTVTFSQVTAQVLENEQVLQNGINLYRGKDPTGICATYRLFFGKGNAQSYQRVAKSGGYSVTYNIHNNINKAGILKEQTDALNSAEWVDMYAPDKFTNYSVPFFISIPDLFTQNYPPKGVYTDNLNVVVWVVKNNNFGFDAATNLAVSIIVPSRLDISLVDEGGSFDAASLSKVFDFGALSQNQVKGADLVVRSNTPYQLKMSSQNGSKLRQGTVGTINYLITSNGSNIGVTNAGTEVNFANGNGTSGVNGDRFNIKVKINESTTSKVAGLYQDVITITAVAN
jgi:spore coat protein U-like protein